MADETDDSSTAKLERAAAASRDIHETLGEKGARLTDRLERTFNYRVFTPAELVTMHVALETFMIVLREPAFRKSVGVQLSDAYVSTTEDIYATLH